MALTKRHLIFAMALLLAVGTWFPRSQAMALEQSEKGLTRALASYALARGLNATISLAQGTEVAVQPAGVGAIIAVGQFLDPINDLVEQFSSLLLLASVAFGLQILLIEFGAHSLLSVMLTVAAVSYGGMTLWRDGSPGWLRRLLLVLVIARFAVPLHALGSEVLYQSFLQDRYVAAHTSLQKESESISRSTSNELSGDAVVAEPPPAEERKGWRKVLPNDWKFPDFPEFPDVRKIPKDISQAAEESVRSIIDVMVLFTLQTVIFPLIFLWLLVVTSKSVLAPAGDHRPRTTSAS